MRPIDADALIAEMHNVILEDGEDRRTFYEVIERQPTIEPQPQWIPCKERLPEKTGPYLVTVRNWNTPQQVDYFSIYSGWMEYVGRVIAWMHLPEPYREDET